MDKPMRDNPVHTFLLFLTGQIPDQIAAGQMRWVTVAVYWLLAVAGIGIALFNWRRDTTQRSTHNLLILAMRYLGGAMFYVGSLWKLPLPVSAGFQSWMENCVKYSSWQFHADIMQFFLNHIVVVGPLVYLLEVSLAASFMLGLMVRLSGIVAALFIFNLMIGLYNDPTEWVWTYVGLIVSFGMFSATQAGRSLGFDNVVAKQLLPVFKTRNAIMGAVRWAS
jgi:uncharacterized membrane protein YphA (DoxX/SURF4 family)